MTSSLPHVTIRRETATCEIALFGATVTRFSLGNRGKGGEDNLLFLSKEAVLDGTKPIRGGIPLVFPIFGAGDGKIALPSHGFARVSTWRVLDEDESSEKHAGKRDDDARVVLVLEPSDVPEQYTKVWPFHFRLEYEVCITPALELATKLRVYNKHEGPFRFQSLLHTYFRVPDCRALRVNVNKRTHYVDQVAKKSKLEMEDTVVRIEKETDYIYAFSSDAGDAAERREPQVVDLFYTVADFEGKRCGMRQTREFIREGKSTPCDLVLWNPWIEKSKKMADFGDEEYLEMICLEPGNVANTAGDELGPGESAELSQVLRFFVASSGEEVTSRV